LPDPLFDLSDVKAHAAGKARRRCIRTLGRRLHGVGAESGDLPLRLLLLRPWRCLKYYRRIWRPAWAVPIELTDHPGQADSSRPFASDPGD
jgi:hypothetical protein